MTDYRNVPLANCGAEHYDPDICYVLPGSFMRDLRRIAYVLSSGDKMDADERRDAAQHMQAVMDVYKDWQSGVLRAFRHGS